MITVGAGVGVLLVIGLVAGFLWLKGDDDAVRQGGPADATAARDVAKSYLEALACGDAEAALALSDNQPATTD
ncbi:MAG: lumazine-binding domain protein, partial [Mycolicibacterium hassiacum]|nr:lumazine-binding domain protein [Mycolicibacterium hassiacum]